MNRKIPPLALIAALILPMVSTQARGADTRQPDPIRTGTVRLGQPLFWTGEIYVERVIGNGIYGLESNLAGGQATDTCDVTNPCWAYEFEVPEAADIMRVGFDSNTREGCYQLELYQPGAYANRSQLPLAVVLQCPQVTRAQVWSFEVRLEHPQQGSWTVRVVPFLVERWGFRLRVALENRAPVSGDITLPNLRALAPYEFGFAAPANPLAGLVVDAANPPGPTGVSCTADELTDAASEGRYPQSCLRLSTAIYNVGDGPLELVLQPDGALGGAVTQRIYRDDGSLAEEVAAGEWQHHVTHNHAHYLGFMTFELYRVSANQHLERVGLGHKTGWNPDDQRIADWYAFDQGVQFGIGVGCQARAEKCITQARGWGDHYRWQRPGNFVDFPANQLIAPADGDYVVRTTADQAGRVRESDESDNTSYAWIRVRSFDITICERGIGLSPWDANKILESNFWAGTPGGTTAAGPAGTC